MASLNTNLSSPVSGERSGPICPETFDPLFVGSTATNPVEDNNNRISSHTELGLEPAESRFVTTLVLYRPGDVAESVGQFVPLTRAFKYATWSLTLCFPWRRGTNRPIATTNHTFWCSTSSTIDGVPYAENVSVPMINVFAVSRISLPDDGWGQTVVTSGDLTFPIDSVFFLGTANGFYPHLSGGVSGQADQIISASLTLELWYDEPHASRDVKVVAINKLDNPLWTTAYNPDAPPIVGSSSRNVQMPKQLAALAQAICWNGSSVGAQQTSLVANLSFSGLKMLNYSIGIIGWGFVFWQSTVSSPRNFILGPQPVGTLFTWSNVASPDPATKEGMIVVDAANGQFFGVTSVIPAGNTTVVMNLSLDNYFPNYPDVQTVGGAVVVSGVVGVAGVVGVSGVPGALPVGVSGLSGVVATPIPVTGSVTVPFPAVQTVNWLTSKPVTVTNFPAEQAVTIDGVVKTTLASNTPPMHNQAPVDEKRNLHMLPELITPMTLTELKEMTKILERWSMLVRSNRGDAWYHNMVRAIAYSKSVTAKGYTDAIAEAWNRLMHAANGNTSHDEVTALNWNKRMHAENGNMIPIPKKTRFESDADRKKYNQEVALVRQKNITYLAALKSGTEQTVPSFEPQVTDPVNEDETEASESARSEDGSQEIYDSSSSEVEDVIQENLVTKVMTQKAVWVEKKPKVTSDYVTSEPKAAIAAESEKVERLMRESQHKCQTYNKYVWLTLQGDSTNIWPNEEALECEIFIEEGNAVSEKASKRLRTPAEKPKPTGIPQHTKPPMAEKVQKEPADKEELRRKRLLNRLKIFANDATKFADWLLTNKIGPSVAGRVIKALDSTSLNLYMYKNKEDKRNQLATALTAASLHEDVRVRAAIFFMLSKKVTDPDHCYYYSEIFTEALSVIQTNDVDKVSADMHNKLMHAYNGNILAVEAARHNREMHALNGNTDSGESGNNSTTVNPVTRSGNKTKEGNQPFGDRMMVPTKNLGSVPTTKRCAVKSLYNWMAKARGFTESAGAYGSVDVIFGDIFMKTQLFNNTTPNDAGSLSCREQLASYRDSTNINIAASTASLRIANTVGLSAIKPNRPYTMTEDAANLAIVTNRMRPDSITFRGFFHTDIAWLIGIGPMQSDDWSYNLMKLFALCFVLHPNQDPDNGIPWRGPLEMIDGRFHIDLGVSPRVIVGLNDSPVFGEDCGAAALRFFPFKTRAYSPVVRFMVNTIAIAEGAKANAIFIPLWCVNVNDEEAELYIRLYVYLFTQAPHGIWTWTVATENTGQQILVPYASQISFTGIDEPVINVILPTGSASTRPPTDAVTADVALFTPTFAGGRVPMEWLGNPAPGNTPLLEWFDEYIDAFCDPTSVVNVINRFCEMTGAWNEAGEALDRMRSLVWRVNPLVCKVRGAQSPIAIAEPAQNNFNEADIVGCTMDQVGVLPAISSEIHWTFGTGTPIMANILAAGVYVTKADPKKLVSWTKQEYVLAQMQTRVAAMGMQMFWDSLGLACAGIDRALNNINNTMLRNFMVSLFVGGETYSNGVTAGLLGVVIDAFLSEHMSTCMPLDRCGNNIFAYRRKPRGVAEPYDFAGQGTAGFFRPSFYQDAWMQLWMESDLLDYCQPPSRYCNNVRLSMLENSLPVGANATAISTFVPPWDISTPFQISANNWFAETNSERRANRRALLWLHRATVSDGQAIMTCVFGNPMGLADVDYTPLNVSHSCVGTAANWVAANYVDVSPLYADKIDVAPYVNVSTWNWIVVMGSLNAGNLQAGLSLLTGNRNVVCSRLFPTNEGASPIALIPGKQQLTNPFASLVNVSSKEEPNRDDEVKA